jgi:hypothetical protein
MVVHGSRGLQSRELVRVTILEASRYRYWRRCQWCDARCEFAETGATQALYGLTETETLGQLDETDDVASDVASEAPP